MKEYLMALAAACSCACASTDIGCQEKQVKTSDCKCYYKTILPLTRDENLENQKNQFILLPGLWQKTDQNTNYHSGKESEAWQKKHTY